MLSNDPKFDTPTIPASAATIIFHTTLRISASAALVFRTVRNTETWKDWNKFSPKVNISYQPPDEDHATNAEVAEIVRRTSIALSHDADMTEALDGAAPRPPANENFDPNWHGRRASWTDSQHSNQNSDAHASAAAQAVANVNASTPTPSTANDNGRRLSAAQKYQVSQETRRASLAAGETPAPVNNQVSTAPATRSNLNPRPSTPNATAKRKQNAINALYGEPSVRIQLNTRLTYHARLSLPSSLASKPVNIIVTEVNRPDDAIEAAEGPKLVRSKTHMNSVTGVYRIVWRTDDKVGKWLFQSERVVEIRPIVKGTASAVNAADVPGDGGECELRTWENQKGMKSQKGKQGEYIQHYGFDVWAEGLREFCESMGGKVERKDFGG